MVVDSGDYAYLRTYRASACRRALLPLVRTECLARRDQDARSPRGKQQYWLVPDPALRLAHPRELSSATSKSLTVALRPAASELRGAACVCHGAKVPPRPSVAVWAVGLNLSSRPRANESSENMAQSSRMESCHRLTNVIGKCLGAVRQVGDNADMTTFASGASASSVSASSRSSDSSRSNRTAACTHSIDQAQRPLRLIEGPAPTEDSSVPPDPAE